jgi:allene oxide cyclase-like protein
MRRVIAIVGGVVMLGLVASMTVVSAERRAPKNDWGLPIATSARGSSATVAPNDDGDQRLVLISRNATETEIDNPPAGESQGDEIAITSPLFRAGKSVGRFDAHIVITELNVQEGVFAFQVTFTSTLPEGQIVSTGVGAFTEESGDDSFSAAITGGTGRFDDAGGDVQVQFISEDAVRFVYDLEDLD